MQTKPQKQYSEKKISLIFQDMTWQSERYKQNFRKWRKKNNNFLRSKTLLFEKHIAWSYSKTFVIMPSKKVFLKEAEKKLLRLRRSQLTFWSQRSRLTIIRSCRLWITFPLSHWSLTHLIGLQSLETPNFSSDDREALTKYRVKIMKKTCWLPVKRSV